MTGQPTAHDHLDEVRLRVEAAAHGGLVPVAFVGTRWHARRGDYWRRRIGGTVVLAVGTAFVGAIAAGTTIGILGDDHPHAIRVVIAAVYLATGLPGLVYGHRIIRRMPLDAHRGPRNPFAGCFALLISPFSTGFCLAILLAALRPQFLGETRARAFSSPSSLG